MKSSNQDILQRQWTIIKLLIAGQYFSTSDIKVHLADQGFDASLRTIQRDLVDLQQTLPIECRKDDKPYSWRWQPTRTDDGYVNEISLSQAIALRLVETELKSIIPTELLEQLQPLFLRANFLIGIRHTQHLKQLRILKEAAEAKERASTSLTVATTSTYDRLSKLHPHHIVVDDTGNLVKDTTLRRLIRKFKGRVSADIRPWHPTILDVNTYLEDTSLLDCENHAEERDEVDMQSLISLQSILQGENLHWLAELL